MPVADRIGEADMPRSSPRRAIGQADMLGALPMRGNGRQSRRAEDTPIDFWQVMGVQRANRPQEAG